MEAGWAPSAGGQTGIAINVPAPVKVRTAEQRERSEQLRQSRKGLAEGPGSLGGELPEGETRMMFKVGHIFDVSQTEGQELPQLKRHPIEGDSHAEYIAKLQTFAGSIGFRVEWRDLSDDARGGWCDYASKLVVADSSVPANAKVRVLVHEVAHALGVSSKEYGRELAEVIVETAAVVVCGSIGLDTTGESVPYVAGWADGDASKVREYAEAVDSVARKLEDAIGIDEFAVVRGCVVKSVAKGAAVWSRPTRRGQCGAVASAAAPPQREARIAMDCPNCGLELWTSREGCAGLGVSRKSWASWRNSSTAGFPAPIGELGGRPVWDAAKVQAWAENRPRLQQS